MPTQTEQKPPTARPEQEQSSLQRKDVSPSTSRTGLMQQRGEYPSGLMPYDVFRMNPFSLLRRMTEEMDRMFQDAGMERAGISSSAWWPAIEVSLRDGNYNVHAELPGLEPKDVKVEVENDALVIEGERKYEHEEKQGGMQRTERQYGFFRRSIPLPEGAKTEQAKAKFHNGVLEIAIPVPDQQTDRRTIPIEAESASSKPPQSQAA